MKDKTLVGGILVMVVGAVLIGIIWFLFLYPAQTPSTPLVAIPVTVDNDGSYTFFEIVPGDSEVTFTLNETLRGLPTTVVGSSQLIAGQIAVDFANPTASQIGPILINARTLFTDNEFRNNAIHNFILDTEAYELITFIPTKINDLPTAFAPDLPYALQIEGDLTIRQITQPVVFMATITSDGRSQLTGSASAQIMRTDFELQIPDAPGVANVGEEIQLSILFTANAHP